MDFYANPVEEAMSKKPKHPTTKRIAILATDGFEQIELTGPRDALQDAGHTTHILSMKSGTVQGFHHDKHGDHFAVDRTLEDAKASDYDAVLLPGGTLNGDAMRTNQHAQALVKAANEAGKPIAAICHGGWLLIDSGVVKGRTMTSWPSLATDIRNAGGTWVDEEVHQDKNLISSRKPDDIPAFNKALLAAVG